MAYQLLLGYAEVIYGFQLYTVQKYILPIILLR